MKIYDPKDVRVLLESYYHQSKKISFCTYDKINSRIMFIPFNQVLLRPCYENYVETVRRFL